MSEPAKLSRRDWFRLKTPSQDASLGDGKKSASLPRLESIEHPPNHDGMDLSELPPMREAVLNDQEVNSLLDDIQSHGNNVQLMQKRQASDARASSAKPNLVLAKKMLLNGDVKRLQVRYQWNDSLWIDTLSREDGKTRLVRIAHTQP